MLALGCEQQDIRLDDVEVGEDDVDGRDEHRTTVRLHVRRQREEEAPNHKLVEQKRSRNLEDLAVVQLVPAAVLGPSLQICVTHALLRSLHAGHFTISLPGSCRSRSLVKTLGGTKTLQLPTCRLP